MSVARKPFLLIVMAIATMALAAPSAFARETLVDIMPEPGGEPCNPCYMHLVGVALTELSSHVFGSESDFVFTCNDEFEGEINKDGKAWFTSYENEHGTLISCLRLDCSDNGGERPIQGKAAGSGEPLVYQNCLLKESDSEQSCLGIEINTETDDLNHVEHFSASEAEGTIVRSIAFCEFSGLWAFESGASPGLEVEYN